MRSSSPATRQNFNKRDRKIEMDVLMKATENLWQQLREIAMDDASILEVLRTAEHAGLSREHTAIALALLLARQKQELIKQYVYGESRSFPNTDFV
jgi:hypothetical protein